MRRPTHCFPTLHFLCTLLLSACTAPNLTPPSTDPAMTILYFTWSGTSPGAGWDGTSLIAFQYDLSQNRVRTLQIAKGPSTVEDDLPWQRDKILPLLAQHPWQPLSPPHARTLRAAADAWLTSQPPPEYHQIHGLGREDGATTELAINLDQHETRTQINPRKNDPQLFPPPEWFVLTTALSEFSGIPQPHPGQIMKLLSPTP